MESMTHYQLHIQELHSRIKRQASDMIMLGEYFTHEAEYQYRYDQARSIDDLKKRVVQEIKEIESMETASAIGFTKATLIASGAKLAIGILWAVARRSEEHPLSAGMRLAQNSLESTAPFGTIVIVVGSGGLPNDIKVIPLSQWAREQDKEESEVVASLRSSYDVMSLESFFGTLEELKRKVLEGTVTLPALAFNLGRQYEK